MKKRQTGVKNLECLFFCFREEEREMTAIFLWKKELLYDNI